ncbi:MAG: PAS domain S-box protein [Polyangiaceae bacterium]|nr:PAS domain S-box protein [Polyangiaceae bacterium]
MINEYLRKLARHLPPTSNDAPTLRAVPGPTKDLEQDPHALYEALMQLRREHEELSIRTMELEHQCEEMTSLATLYEKLATFYTELFDDAPDPLFLTDDEGKIRDANAAGCRLLKSAPLSLFGVELVSLVHPSHRDAFNVALRVSQVRAVELPSALHTRAGSTVSVTLRGQPMRRLGMQILWSVRTRTPLALRHNARLRR